MPFSSLTRRCLTMLLAAVIVPCGVRAEDSAYSRAQSLLHDHQWDQGLVILQELLKNHPTDPKTLNLMGLAFTGKGDPKQADIYFQAALNHDPHFVPALKNLAINEVELKELKSAHANLELARKLSPEDAVIQLYSGEISFREQDFRRAVEMFAQAGGLLQRNPNMVSHLAVSYLKTGDTDNALRTLGSIRTDELSPQSQFLLGVTLAQADQNARAIPYLEAVQHAYPSSYDIGYNLTLCYIAAKQFPQAISTAHDLIAAGHETAELDNVLAEAYVDNKEPQPAVEALRRAIALNPDDDDNYLDFASLCMNNHAFDDASRVLDVGLRVHPKSARLIFERGILNAMLDHYDLAEKDFEQSSVLEPDKDSGYIGLGVTYIETGKSAQAVPLLRKRLREKPDDANLLYLLGEALVRSGAAPGDKAFAEAQASLEKSVTLNPAMCLPHIELGGIYMQEGRIADAVPQFEQARLIDPKEKSSYSHLAIAYRRLGQPEKAKEMVSFLRDINDEERANPNPKMRAADEAAPKPANLK